jgi:hypothetical protein
MKLNVPGYMPTSKIIPPSIYENYQWCFVGIASNRS